MTNGKNAIANYVRVEYLDGKRELYGSHRPGVTQVFVEIKDRYVEIVDNSVDPKSVGFLKRVCIPIATIRFLEVVDLYERSEGRGE